MSEGELLDCLLAIRDTTTDEDTAQAINVLILERWGA